LLQSNTVQWAKTVTFFASKKSLILQVFKALLQSDTVKWGNTVTFFASKMSLVLQVFKALLRPIPSNGVISSPFRLQNEPRPTGIPGFVKANTGTVKWGNTVPFFASKINLVLQVFQALLGPIP
jgi:hypothetical protein